MKARTLWAHTILDRELAENGSRSWKQRDSEHGEWRKGEPHAEPHL